MSSEGMRDKLSHHWRGLNQIPNTSYIKALQNSQTNVSQRQLGMCRLALHGMPLETQMFLRCSVRWKFSEVCPHSFQWEKGGKKRKNALRGFRTDMSELERCQYVKSARSRSGAKKKKRWNTKEKMTQEEHYCDHCFMLM